MPSEADKVNTPGIKNVYQPYGVGQKDESPVDVMLKIRQQKMLEDFMKEGNVSKQNEGEGLAAAIVKKAMEISDGAATRAEQAAKQGSEAIEKARKEADDAKQGMLTIVLQQIADIAKGLEKTGEEIVKGHPPKNTLDIIREAKELHAIFFPEGGGGNKELPTPPAVDGRLQMEILKMQQDFQLALKKYDIELENIKTERTLKMAQWEADNKLKREEYEDGKAFRNQGLGALNDIVASAAAGFSARRGIISEEVVGQPPIADSDNVTPAGGVDNRRALVRGFKCQICGTPIAVTDEGEEVACPNKACGAIYQLERNSQ